MVFYSNVCGNLRGVCINQVNAQLRQIKFKAGIKDHWAPGEWMEYAHQIQTDFKDF